MLISLLKMVKIMGENICFKTTTKIVILDGTGIY
jgi:hypothetical protein